MRPDEARPKNYTPRRPKAGRQKSPPPKLPNGAVESRPSTESDPLDPPLSVLVKLGSIAVHSDEMLSPDGHAFDKTALEQLLQDVEVVAWLAAMQSQALVPLKRK